MDFINVKIAESRFAGTGINEQQLTICNTHINIHTGTLQNIAIHLHSPRMLAKYLFYVWSNMLLKFGCLNLMDLNH